MTLPFALKVHAIEQLLLMVSVGLLPVHTIRAPYKHEMDCRTSFCLPNRVLLGKLLNLSFSVTCKVGLIIAPAL